jgi:hypothetical protein
MIEDASYYIGRYIYIERERERERTFLPGREPLPVVVTPPFRLLLLSRSVDLKEILHRLTGG